MMLTDGKESFGVNLDQGADPEFDLHFQTFCDFLKK